jgi:hypothetical protein
MCISVRDGIVVEFLNAVGYLFSVIVSVGCGKGCNSSFSFKPSVVSQLFLRLCRLYLGPFSRRLISLFVKMMLVLFTTLG